MMALAVLFLIMQFGQSMSGSVSLFQKLSCVFCCLLQRLFCAHQLQLILHANTWQILQHTAAWPPTILQYHLPGEFQLVLLLVRLILLAIVCISHHPMILSFSVLRLPARTQSRLQKRAWVIVTLILQVYSLSAEMDPDALIVMDRAAERLATALFFRRYTFGIYAYHEYRMREVTTLMCYAFAKSSLWCSAVS